MKKILSLMFLATLLLTITSCGKDSEDDSNKLDAPEILAPTSGQIFTGFSNPGTSACADYDWTDVANATEYQVQTSTTSDFSLDVSSKTVTNSNYCGVNLFNDTGADIAYYVRVRAISPDFENSDWSAAVSYTVTSANGGGNSFNLLTPANNSTNIALNSTFTCESVPNASLYTFYFESTNGSNFTETSVSPQVTTSQLANNTIYTWLVEASIPGNALYTTVWSFETETGSTGSVPVLVSPSNGSSINTSTPTFNWNGVTGATSYTWEIASDNTFSNILATQTVSGTSFTVPSNTPLPSGVTFYWRVKANNSNYSTVFSLYVN